MGSLAAGEIGAGLAERPREGYARTLLHPGGKPDVGFPDRRTSIPANCAGMDSGLVLHVRPNEVTKYMDDEESSTPMGHLGDKISDWISSELTLLR